MSCQTTSENGIKRMKSYSQSFFRCNAGHAPIAGQSAANIMNLECKHVNTSTQPPCTMSFRVRNQVQNHLSGHALRMSAWSSMVQTEQRSEQIGPKPQRLRAYHLQLQGIESLSHTHGTTRRAANKDPESVKKCLGCSMLTSE